jgi:hypothetical protein
VEVVVDVVGILPVVDNHRRIHRTITENNNNNGPIMVAIVPTPSIQHKLVINVVVVVELTMQLWSVWIQEEEDHHPCQWVEAVVLKSLQIV